MKMMNPNGLGKDTDSNPVKLSKQFTLAVYFNSPS